MAWFIVNDKTIASNGTWRYRTPTYWRNTKNEKDTAKWTTDIDLAERFKTHGQALAVANLKGDMAHCRIVRYPAPKLRHGSAQ
jgi:hypothetical protein